MADGLKAALQSKLATYESAGMADHAKRVKARIAQLEKRGSKADLITGVTYGGVELSKVTAPKKSAAKKTAAKKRK